MNALRNWSLGFLATAAAVVVSYYWLDRPIALFVHTHVARSAFFERLTLIPEALDVLALAAFLALAAYAVTGHRLSRLQTVFLLCGLSLAVGIVLKDVLKGAFGRPWPESWLIYNPSFIHDGAYGFHPFRGGPYYESFPSGHAAMACTMMTVLWICYPRFRPLYALCMVAVSVGLVGANFHFLGDVIAGSFVGISAGWFCVTLWENGYRQVRGQAATNTSSENLDPSLAKPPAAVKAVDVSRTQEAERAL